MVVMGRPERPGGYMRFPLKWVRGVGIPGVKNWKKGFIRKEIRTSSRLRQTDKGPLHPREFTLLSGTGRV